MIPKRRLEDLYIKQGLSVQKVADKLGYSRRGVKYWIDKHNIPVRSMSEAIYLWHNPKGDPFKFRKPQSRADWQLYGMGLGLYWGEGTKSNKYTIRLGNTDPELITTFVEFLERIFCIQRSDLKFGLQIFSDIDPEEALNYWTNALKVDKKQFHRPTITKSGSIGTYRKKSKYGVATVHYNNRKARDILVSLLPM